MASEQLPVNGTFAPTQTQAYTVDQPIVNTEASDINGAQSNDIPKDEVGWYFVEQYYTQLSKNPEKLYLFYNKRSQFVSGSETEKVNVCVGQKAIDERIKALDIQDCKVRVTNVDSQGSGQNIVIQVIGEMSNKNTPRTKFTQTFVLAEQTNGYFVLNDIFRYMVDEDDEVEPAAEEAEVALGERHVLSNSQDPDERERDAQLVDQGLEEARSNPVEPPAAAVNGEEPVQVAVAAEEAPVAATANVAEEDEAAPAVEPAVVAAEVATEKPLAPQSTPAPILSPQPAAARPAAPSKPTKPSGPKTWANLVAANKAPVALPQAPSSTSPAPASQPKAATAAAAASAAPSKPAASTSAAPTATPSVPSAAAAGAEIEHPDTPASSGSEWQTAQQHHGKKQQRTQSTATPAANSRAYMKNVGEAVTDETLRATLSKFGELLYLDINRQKNCAFADFGTPAAYQAAVAANPHDVNGERIFVEERRVRPQSFGGSFAGRGGAGAPRGRGNADRPGGGQGRGGFQGGNKEGGQQRGGFAGRGRANPRGRGAANAAA